MSWVAPFAKEALKISTASLVTNASKDPGVPESLFPISEPSQLSGAFGAHFVSQSNAICEAT